MDEDSPKWSWVPQSHIDWSSQYCSESPALEVAGCEWHYAFLVVKTRNDDDDDDDVDDDDEVDYNNAYLSVMSKIRDTSFTSYERVGTLQEMKTACHLRGSTQTQHITQWC